MYRDQDAVALYDLSIEPGLKVCKKGLPGLTVQICQTLSARHQQVSDRFAPSSLSCRLRREGEVDENVF